MLANPRPCLKGPIEPLSGHARATNGLRKMRIGELVLSNEEAALAEQIAKRKGISLEEAGTLVLKGEIAHRVRKRTGKTPAKVYPIKRK